MWFIPKIVVLIIVLIRKQPNREKKGLQMNDVNTEQFDLAELSKLRGVADERRRVVIHSWTLHS